MFIFIFLIFTIVIMACISRTYERKWDKNLKVDIMFNKNSLFEGETGEVHEIITNKKMLPVWWGRIQFFVSNFIQFDGVNIDHDYYKKDIISILSYERIKRTLKFTASKRGYYKIEKAEMTTDDIFFKYRFIKEFPVFSELYVYPDIKRAVNMDIDFKRIVGEVVTKRTMVEDPFEFRGIRDYHPFDSLKMINWKASARANDIKVNEYNCTASQEVMLLLDFDKYFASDEREIKEDIISIGAYFTREFIKKNTAVGIYSNATNIITQKEVKSECKDGLNQNLFIYKQMAVMDTKNISRPFNNILDDLLKTRSIHYQYILISHYSGNDLRMKIDVLKAAGYSIKWLVVKEKSEKNDSKRLSEAYVCEVSH